MRALYFSFLEWEWRHGRLHQRHDCRGGTSWGFWERPQEFSRHVPDSNRRLFSGHFGEFFPPFFFSKTKKKNHLHFLTRMLQPWEILQKPSRPITLCARLSSPRSWSSSTKCWAWKKLLWGRCVRTTVSWSPCSPTTRWTFSLSIWNIHQKIKFSVWKWKNPP